MSRHSQSQHLPGGVLAAFGLLVALAAGSYQYAANFRDEQTRSCTITSVDRTNVVSDGQSTGSDARVYTRQCGTLAVRDVWLRGQFTSADLYGQLGPGEWELTTAGTRIGLFSLMPVVLRAEPLTSPDTPTTPGDRPPAP